MFIRTVFYKIEDGAAPKQEPVGGQGPRSRVRVAQKGANGVSTNGVTANFTFFDGLLGYSC